MCGDEKCKGGTDNKCTIDNHGCDCKPSPDCPMYENTPFCDDCGGSVDGKCKGVSTFHIQHEVTNGFTIWTDTDIPI